MFVSSKVRVVTDETGSSTVIPGVLTPNGVVMPVVDYLLLHCHTRSPQWMKKVVRSVVMFLEYLHANPSEFDTALMFRNFAAKLYTGTFDLRSGLDPSGLAWSARPNADVQHIVTDLTLFFRWLGNERPAAAKINPLYSGSPYDIQCDAAAYAHRRDAALLGHTWSAGESSGAKFRAGRVPDTSHCEPPAFPDDRFMDLLTEGFKIGNRYDLRGILITLLCHGAGFRESEPFHLYIEDVVPDPSNPRSALVRIHHPSQGNSPRGWRDVQGRERKGNRAKYLAERFGLLPRHKVHGTQAAGWKGGWHDGKHYKEAHWFPLNLGELFLSVWGKYLLEVSRVNRTHPFAFINLRRQPVGEMYTVAQFNKAHARACVRIGLTVSKALGTTEHGHRHAYGRRLKNAEVSDFYLRRFLHHSSEESQKVYTNPTGKETREALAIASENLQKAHPSRAFPTRLPGME